MLVSLLTAINLMRCCVMTPTTNSRAASSATSTSGIRRARIFNILRSHGMDRDRLKRQHAARSMPIAGRWSLATKEYQVIEEKNDTEEYRPRRPLRLNLSILTTWSGTVGNTE